MVTKEEVFSNLTIKQDAGVPFNRTNPVPLDKHSIFASKADAISYATLSATAYPGQVIAINEDELTPWTAECEQLTTAVPSFEMSFENNAWKVSFSNGYTTTAGMGGGFERYDVETSSWLTSDFTVNDLSLRLKEYEGHLMIPMTSSETMVSVYFSRAETNTWNLYVLDASAPNNLKKIEGGSGSGGGGSSGDVEAEEARAKAVEQLLSTQLTALQTDVNTISTTTITALSNAISTLSDSLSDYLPLSGEKTISGSVTVNSNLNVTGEGSKLSINNFAVEDAGTAGMKITSNDPNASLTWGGDTAQDTDIMSRSEITSQIESQTSADVVGNGTGITIADSASGGKEANFNAGDCLAVDQDNNVYVSILSINGGDAAPF